jgi:RNA polymerase sigma factor (sigma-70 family)
MDTRALPTWEGRRPRLGLPVSRLGDEALARLVERGEERSFAALFERHHQTLYRYCLSIVRSETDAEDAVQSVFASAYVALCGRRRDAPLRPWLFRIAHNESVSVLRRRRPEAELTEGLVAAALPVEDTALQRERLSRLVTDVLELPERQRAALVMRELNGLSHEEIAVALECSPGAAKQTIFEARRALAELEEGRAMSCDEICRRISDGDRRALRGRRVRAHLRECAACAAFAKAIPARTADLRALAPTLPAGAAGMALVRTLSASAGSGSRGRVTAGAVGKAAAGVTGAKVTAGAVLLTTAAIGVVHLGERRHPSASARPVIRADAVRPAGATGATTGITATRKRTAAPAAPAGARRSPGVRASGGRAHQGLSVAGAAPVSRGRSAGAAKASAGAAGRGHAATASAAGRGAGAGHGWAYGRTGSVPRANGLEHARAPSTSRGAAGGVQSSTSGGRPGSERSVSGSVHRAAGSAHASPGAAQAAPGSDRGQKGGAASLPSPSATAEKSSH